MSIDLKWVSLDSVCTLEKGAINPQLYPETKFAHYSIPAFDELKEPAIEYGSAIRSNKTKTSNKAVLVSKLNPRIPRVWLIRDELGLPHICSTEFVPFLPDETRLDREYLYWSLNWLLIAGTIKGSTLAATKSRERAKPSDIARQRIPLPPIPEQRRLVDILSRAEGIVRLRREAQKRAQKLIPALFLDMFGDPATNPRVWPVATIGQVIESADYGSSRKASDDGAGFPIIRMGNVD
jgi:type I restriction enzyme S subunit